MDGRKSPPRCAVTASIVSLAPMATCTGKAEMRRRPGGAPRPPCHAYQVEGLWFRV
jgi:hypothetical protein